MVEGHPLFGPTSECSRLRMAEHALLLILRDAGLLRSVRLERHGYGYRLVGRISPWWWLALGVRHLLVRRRVARLLPLVRSYAGFTLGVESLWVL